jgi:hypothetical protein
MFGRQQRFGSQTVDGSVPREIPALLSSERLILRETKRAVTPLGRVIRLRLLSAKTDLVAQVRQHMPIQWKSRNQIDPTTIFIAFLARSQAFFEKMTLGPAAMQRLGGSRWQLLG